MIGKQNKKTFKSKKINRKTLKRRNKKLFGGKIDRSEKFIHIKSIGFEIETTELIKFTKENVDGRYILVNSALTNIDLEYGYSDANEYTDIIDTPNIKFKITNDSAEDAPFNEYLEENIFSIHRDKDDQEREYDEDEDEEDCEDVVLQLRIPIDDEYNTQNLYDIKVREPSGELVNCSSFTDVEWIITYYNPIASDNIILNYFFESMGHLKEHLSQLETINNSELLYLNNEDTDTFIPLSYNNVNQSYVLPGTSLVYFNSSSSTKRNYDINNDLTFVVQMTFSCDIQNTIPIMKELLSIHLTEVNKALLESYRRGVVKNSSLREIYEMIDHYNDKSNPDLFAIEQCDKITKEIFDIYNKNESVYKIDILSDKGKQIYSYFFLIIYKLFIYFNFYLEKPDDLLKKHLSFAVRHNNYTLFLEIRKLIAGMFFNRSTFNEDISKIIFDIIKPLDDNVKILKMLFYFPIAKSLKKEMIEKKKNPDISTENFGNPLVSISNYFEYFIRGKSSEEDDTKDWLVINNIDTKSTKFPLNNNTIIIEFRDFPKYCYLYLFLNTDDDNRKKLLKNNIGTLSMQLF